MIPLKDNLRGLLDVFILFIDECVDKSLNHSSAADLDPLLHHRKYLFD